MSWMPNLWFSIVNDGSILSDIQHLLVHTFLLQSISTCNYSKKFDCFTITENVISLTKQPSFLEMLSLKWLTPACPRRPRTPRRCRRSTLACSRSRPRSVEEWPQTDNWTFRIWNTFFFLICMNPENSIFCYKTTCNMMYYLNEV